MKDFLDRYIPDGQIPTVARKAGIHPNTVYSWKSGRNYPNTMMLVWFFRALSELYGTTYEKIWLDFIYTVEGIDSPEDKALGTLGL
tara:strand:- start:1322 stop:1579 length:258 start_codon:yes stop_codon:yes gene_type:complete